MAWGDMTQIAILAQAPQASAQRQAKASHCLEWRMTPESGCTYGIPEGMVIRNTFLEFGDIPAGEGGKPDIFRAGSADLTEAQRHLLPQPQANCRVRAQSCPAEALAGDGDIRKDNDSSLDSTRSPTTEGGADAEDWQGSMEAPKGRQAPKWRRWEEHQEDASQWTSHASVGFSQSPKSGGRGKKGSQPPSASNHHTLVLRGLPFNVSETEIWQFLESSGVGQDQLADDSAVVLLSNAQGRPSGFAEVYLARGADFWTVRDRLHMKRLGGRYIEALPPRAGKKPQGGGRGGSWRR